MPRIFRVRKTFRLFLQLLLFFLTCNPALGADPVRVQVQGLEGKALENVEGILRIPPGIVQGDGKVNLPLLGRFAEDVPDRVRQALQPFGYYESRVDANLRQTSPDSYVIVVDVKPGQPVRVGSVSVTVEGPGKEQPPLIGQARHFPLKPGDRLRQDIYEKAKAELQGRAVDLGYLNADFTTHLISINLLEKRADIELVLTTGSRYFFNGITFSGAPSYPDRFLQRYLTFRSGEPFSYAKLAETQVNLRNSERFRDIVMKADRNALKEGDLVPVTIGLTPAPTKRLRAGVGYETNLGPRVSLLYQDLNVFSLGHEFDAELNISPVIQGVAARYVVPESKSPLSFTAFKAAVQREDVPTYTARVGMFEIDRERSVGKGATGAAFVRFLYEDSDIGGRTQRSYLTLPGIKYVGQNYDSIIRPTKGYRVSGELRGTTRLLGSDQTFIQFLAQGVYLRRLSNSFILHTRARMGLSLQQESLNDLPVTLRFFAGGDRSVRGYAYQSLGPKNDAGDVIGGKNLVAGSMELERIIGENWGIAAFYDAGNAFNDIAQITLFQGLGLGVRYYTRVGPIELDVARPLDKSSPVVRIHLSFGIGT